MILIIASFYLSPLLRFGVCPDLVSVLDWPDLSAISTYLLFFYIFDFYNPNDRVQSIGYFVRFLLALIVADLFIATLFYVFNIRPYATIILVLNTLLILLLCLGWRCLFHRWTRLVQKPLQVLIIGAGRIGHDLYEQLVSYNHFEVAGFLDDDPLKLNTAIGNAYILGDSSNLNSYIQSRHIDIIVIAFMHKIKKDLIKQLIHVKSHGVSVYDVSTFCEGVMGKIPVQHIGDPWFVFGPISGVRRTIYNQKVKKIIDVILSLCLLILTSPLFLLIALAIKCDSVGPIFYRQRRIGWHGQPFTLLKFRSMKTGRDKERQFAGQKNDPRITRVGKIIRKTRMDELPQLWNVIRGEMSFIGPRALIEEEVREFEVKIPYFSLRQSIKPGITGWAQINYPHGATVQDGLRKLEYDLYYIKNLSPILDLIIFARTIRTVLFGTGAR